MPVGLKFVITVLFCGVICAFVYYGTEKIYTVNGFSERVDELKVLIKLRKKIAKKKDIDKEQEEKLNKVIGSLYENG